MVDDSGPVLSLLGILSLDWNFRPFLGIFEKYENV